jgi:DNA invertase Pin-like site-specific DNA recombinase
VRLLPVDFPSAEEMVSGAAKRRPVFEQMLADARSREFDALVV